MSDLKGKRLLVLGGSRVSCEIVRKAQAMGIYTMVTDWYPLEKSPAKQLADEYFMTSTADIDAMVELIKENKVDGITTGFTDSVLPYYAQICEEAGIPCYGTKEQFDILTNKNLYKKLCRDYGVPVVDEYNIEYDDLFTEKVNEFKFPVIVKPSDGSGANGVSICRDKNELIIGYKKALEFSKSKEIIVERFLEGKEVTVFYTLDNGSVYLTGMGNRHIRDNQDDAIPLPVAYTFPSVHLERYRDKVEPNVKRMFQSLGMKNGMVFMQCLVEDGDCLVYDIGYRLTGSLEYKLMEEIQNYNPLEMLIRFAITGSMTTSNLEEKINPVWERYACNVSFLIKPGIIETISGIDEIKRIPGVIAAVLARVEGEEIPETAKGTLRQIVLRVFATAKDEKELKMKLNNIYQSIEVIGENNEQLLLEGLDSNEVKGVLL